MPMAMSKDKITRVQSRLETHFRGRFVKEVIEEYRNKGFDFENSNEEDLYHQMRLDIIRKHMS